MKLIRRASEAEAIAEFLKNEFYREEFHPDRAQFESLVRNGNIADERENVLRRALLFRRRGAMWRELPGDTQWWKVQLEPSDLQLLYVFPRAHWRKIAGGDFRLTAIVERLRARGSRPFPHGFVPPGGRAPRNVQEFISKIQSLSYRLHREADTSSILLIGIAENRPMLIFEGNHRLTAALLASPETFQDRFQVFFGVSPNMVRCCWYRATFGNLLRYAKNRVLHLGYDREADVNRILREFDRQLASELAEAVNSGKVLPESKGATTSVRSSP